jgi:hypothetical protein
MVDRLEFMLVLSSNGASAAPTLYGDPPLLVDNDIGFELYRPPLP